MKRGETYLGSVCKRGHDGLRYLSNRACVACKDEAHKKEIRTAADLERMKVASRAWYIRNKSTRPDQQRKRRLSDIRAYKGEQRRSYQKHREKRLVQCREYYEKNKDKVAAKVAARRARKLGGGGRHTAEDIRRIYKRQRGRCGACREKLKKYHKDHILPLALGGDNNATNIQLLCAGCNLQKHAKHPVEFMQEKGFLV